MCRFFLLCLIAAAPAVAQRDQGAIQSRDLAPPDASAGEIVIEPPRRAPAPAPAPQQRDAPPPRTEAAPESAPKAEPAPAAPAKAPAPKATENEGRIVRPSQSGSAPTGRVAAFWFILPGS